SEAESIQETSVEPVQETQDEQSDTPRFVTAQESKVIPIEESEIELPKDSEAEPIQETNFEPVQESMAEESDAPKFVTAQESKVIPIEESEIESSQNSEAESIQETSVEPVQETQDEQSDTPKFVTAQESKVIPIEESEIELPKDSEAEPVQESKTNTPKFVTAQESKVIPIEESDIESPKDFKSEPARQSKFKKDKKPKVIPVKEPKKADFGDIAKKVSKKSSVVKVSSESSWKQIISKLCEAKPGASTTKQKAMVVMIPVLFIVLVAFVFRGGVFGTSVHNAQAVDENNTGLASAGLNHQIDWEIPEPYPTTLRDPMQLGSVVTGNNQAENNELVKLIVKSILYSEDNSSAIISNRIVHEGDQIQGASITKINKDSVEFDINGKKWSQGIQR
ncbi:MAG: hypothetical protein RQ760_18265, partial [Sedimentisphaerales bacterium]|nr:hypothetical protein [Sedimentisphaerales bacterium]